LIDSRDYMDEQIRSLNTNPQRTHELKIMRHTLSCTIAFINEPHTDKIKLT